MAHDSLVNIVALRPLETRKPVSEYTREEAGREHARVLAILLKTLGPKATAAYLRAVADMVDVEAA